MIDDQSSGPNDDDPLGEMDRVTQVKRCPDCKGTGIIGHTKIGLDRFEPIVCPACLGNGQVLLIVKREEK